MAEMIILQGPPCSGKSTWARSFVAGKKDFVIVSLNSIRYSLGDYWQPKREQYVSVVEEYMITTAFRMNYGVVVDATNLDKSRIDRLQKIAADLDVPSSFEKLYISFREACRRDKNADRIVPLGEDKIRQFYEKYFAGKLAEELASPEPETAAESPAIVTAGGRHVVLDAANLGQIKKLASLKYSPLQIALMLEIPVVDFRLMLADTDSPASHAYRSGKLESTIAYRNRVRVEAEAGEEWAINMLEKWEIQQKEDEFGCHN